MRDLIEDIAGQPQTLLENAALLSETFSRLPAQLGHPQRIVITGMATSLWAWHSAGLVLETAREAPKARIVDTGEYLRYGAAKADSDPLLITSRSGESVEILRLLESLAPGRDITSFTATGGSSLAQQADRSICFSAEEQAFYNTKSYLMTLASALVAAAGLAGRTDLDPDRWLDPFSALLIGFIAEETPAYQEIAELLAASRVVLLSARGHLIGVTQQASLDLQEGMRIGAMSVPAGLLRHGPLELTTAPDALTVLLIPNDHMAQTNVKLAQDIHGHGGRLAVLAEIGVQGLPDVPTLRLPSAATELLPMLWAVAFQKLNVALAQRLAMAEIRPTLIPKVTRVE